MSTKNHHTQGYIFITITCLTNAFAFVFIAHLNQAHNELLSLALTFGYATIAFNLVNFKQLPHLYKLVANNFPLFFKMNVVTFISWLGAFYALNYLDPATVICLGFGIIAVTNFFIITPLTKLKQSKHLTLCVVLILFSMGLLVSQYLISNTHSLKDIMLGVMWCIIDGFFGGFIGICSVKMGSAGFSITQILATRFQMLVVVSAVAFLLSPHSMIIVIDWKYYLLASIIIVFLPLLAYQAALKNLGALIVSFLEPFTPIITYFLQVAVTDHPFNIIRVFLLLFTCLSIIWLIRLEHGKI